METTMRLSKMGAALALASTLVVAFILCGLAQIVWPAAQFTHVWLTLFTAAPLGSVAAWVEGIIASVVVGFILGWCFAHCYNWAVGRNK